MGEFTKLTNDNGWEELWRPKVWNELLNAWIERFQVVYGVSYSESNRRNWYPPTNDSFWREDRDEYIQWNIENLAYSFPMGSAGYFYARSMQRFIEVVLNASGNFVKRNFNKRPEPYKWDGEDTNVVRRKSLKDEMEKSDGKGWRRIKEWKSTYQIDSAPYEYGPIQAGDIVGPWIIEDLQEAFSLMDTTAHYSEGFNRFGRIIGTKQVLMRSGFVTFNSEGKLIGSEVELINYLASKYSPEYVDTSGVSRLLNAAIEWSYNGLSEYSARATTVRKEIWHIPYIPVSVNWDYYAWTNRGLSLTYNPFFLPVRNEEIAKITGGVLSKGDKDKWFDVGSTAFPYPSPIARNGSQGFLTQPSPPEAPYYTAVPPAPFNWEFIVYNWNFTYDKI